MLVEAVAALRGRKLILTNGSRDHALRTAAQLGFAATSFEDVFDIVAADFVPKPDAATYDRFFAAHGVDPAMASMFEDIARNLEVPHVRGMVTMLVAPKLGDDRHREAGERLGNAEPHVDVVTDDLAGLLAAVVLARRTG